MPHSQEGRVEGESVGGRGGEGWGGKSGGRDGIKAASKTNKKNLVKRLLTASFLEGVETRNCNCGVIDLTGYL